MDFDFLEGEDAFWEEDLFAEFIFDAFDPLGVFVVISPLSDDELLCGFFDFTNLSEELISFDK